jgi:hypothetical protein
MQDTVVGYDRTTHSTGCKKTDVNMKTLETIIKKIREHNKTWRAHLKDVDITIPDWVMEQ